MKLYTTRHGQSEWNVLHKICGRADAKLTEEGRAQALELAKNAEGLGIEIIISSPLARAKETAEIVGKIIGARVETDKRLIEQDYGDFEGSDWRSEDFIECKKHFAKRCPNGESTLQLAHRIYGFLEDIGEKYRGKTLLIVAHYGVLRVIDTYFEDLTNEEFYGYKHPNCTVKGYELER